MKLATALDGRTPHASLQALLYVEAKKPDGLFIRPPDTKGVFDLRERSPKLRAVR